MRLLPVHLHGSIARLAGAPDADPSVGASRVVIQPMAFGVLKRKDPAGRGQGSLAPASVDPLDQRREAQRLSAGRLFQDAPELRLQGQGRGVSGQIHRTLLETAHGR